MTNLLASVELVIFPSALPAKTSWKSLAGASTEFSFDFGKNSFAFSSCEVPSVVAIVTLLSVSYTHLTLPTISDV